MCEYVVETYGSRFGGDIKFMNLHQTHIDGYTLSYTINDIVTHISVRNRHKDDEVYISIINKQFEKSEGYPPRMTFNIADGAMPTESSMLFDALYKCHQFDMRMIQGRELYAKNKLCLDALREYLENHDETASMYFKDVQATDNVDHDRALVIHWYGEEDFKDRSYHLAEAIMIITRLREAREAAQKVDIGSDGGED